TFSQREKGLLALEIVEPDSSLFSALRRYFRDEPLSLGERGWVKATGGPYSALWGRLLREGEGDVSARN
ncbi:MAG: hypothetical protein WCF81_11955, partial [Roseiarcus sp.]